MPVIETQLDTQSEAYSRNRAFMLEYVQRIRDVEARIQATEEAYRPRAEKRGKLLPRERLAALLDPGSPFIELSSIGGYKMYGDTDGSTAGGNLICGIGMVSGRRTAVLVWNYAVKGGTINAVTTRKHLRLQEICFQNRLPTVSLSESGGGDLAGSGTNQDPWGAAGFLDGGRVYCQQAELSAAGLPQVIVAHGNATAGGAYHVGLSDYIVLVRGKSQFFLAGPPLLKAATGEVATAEALGGAEMHARISGTGEYLAEDDGDGVRVAREILAQLPPDPQVPGDQVGEAPLYPEEELLGVVSADKRVPFDIREVIARIVDGSRFLDFQ
ncbi:MAG: carboxyl transferase domain-containing protein, partial [Pseudomonadota bacterium]|nr:carboxyl transferase domain-containing protein [Pseudomonadota bacterium]